MAKKKKSADNVIQIPFGKAGDPVQETSQFGRIPEGTYFATLFKIDPRETRDGVPMIGLDLRIDTAPAKNKHVSDVFVIQSGKNANMFAVQRLHGVLVASGIKQQESTVSSDALIKNMEGRQLVVEIVDHEIPATDDYEMRKTSKPSGYYRLDSEEADRVDGATSASDDEEEGDGDGDGEFDEESRPKRKAKKSKSKKRDRDDGGCDDEDCEIEDCDGDHDGDDGGCDDEDCEIEDCDGDHEEEEEPPPKKKGKGKKGKGKKSKKVKADDDGDDDGDFDADGDDDGDELE